MKYLVILLSVFTYSCTKDKVPILGNYQCTNGSIEVVNTNPHFWVQVYLNGNKWGNPIMQYQEVEVDTLRSGVVYNVSAVNLWTKDSVTYPITLTLGDCGGTVTQDVNP